jgi:hypothetical protein
MTWEELRQIPLLVREKMIFGQTKQRGKALDRAYTQAGEWLKGHKIDITRYISKKEGFAEALLRGNPNIPPVVMLCENPESSKLRRRLEFLRPSEITLKRKAKVVDTLDLTGLTKSKPEPKKQA